MSRSLQAAVSGEPLAPDPRANSDFLSGFGRVALLSPQRRLPRGS